MIITNLSFDFFTTTVTVNIVTSSLFVSNKIQTALLEASPTKHHHSVDFSPSITVSIIAANLFTW